VRKVSQIAKTTLWTIMLCDCLYYSNAEWFCLHVFCHYGSSRCL